MTCPGPVETVRTWNAEADLTADLVAALRKIESIAQFSNPVIREIARAALAKVPT